MSYCPNCRYEYVEGIKKCSDCDVELVAEIPPETENAHIDEELEPVFSSWDTAVIDIVKGILESAGIPSWRRSEAIKFLKGFTAVPLAEENLFVLASKVDEAREVIKEALESGKE